MDTACKWSTIALFWMAFFGLVALSGCIHVVELMGSFVIAGLAARWVYQHACTQTYEQPAERGRAHGESHARHAVHQG